MVNILAISGSLRINSSNSLIIREIKKWIPEGVNYLIYEDLDKIPPFNDPEEIPGIVNEWINKIAGADAVLFCSPEYAFGVPGALKNALDWTVGSVAFSSKPVALITASSGGEKAHASLLLTLTALGTDIIDDLLISYARMKINKEGGITDENTLQRVRSLINKLISSVSV